MSASFEGLDDVVRDFLAESAESLDQIDGDLIALETPDQDGEAIGPQARRAVLGSIFRTVHTIKGTSGFLSFPRLGRLAHVGEGLLAKLRDGDVELTPEIVGDLLALVDALREILVGIESTGSEPDDEHRELSDRLEALARTSSGDDIPLPQESRGDGAPHGEPAGSQDALVLPPSSALPGFGGPPLPVPVAGTGRPGVPDEGLPVDEEALPPATMLGQVLVAAESVSPDDVSDAVLRQLAGDQRPLGEILATSGAVSAGAIAAALEVQQRTKARRALSDASVRVDVELLDEILDLVGELVVARNTLLRESAGRDSAAAQELSRITNSLQRSVTRTRMQRLDTLWAKVPRVVRDLGVQCGKQVRLEIEGGDVEVDRALLDAVKDPLIHLVRNAIDHGLEGPLTRRAAGKRDTGTLHLRAYHAGGRTVIDVIDDGQGLDPVRLVRSALRQGLVTAEQIATATPQELADLVFLPGVSTADTVTTVSGRGVGMDVVRTDIEACGGRVEVNSRPGQGTTVRMILPLTLDILPALIVTAGEQVLAIPETHVVGTSRLADHPLPDRPHSLLSLRDILGLPGTAAGEAVVVSLQTESGNVGLIVDAVRAVEEITVKPLPARFGSIAHYSGASVLGDGSVALILDASAIGRSVAVPMAEINRVGSVRATAGGRIRGDDVVGHRGGRPGSRLPVARQGDHVAVFRMGGTRVAFGASLVEHVAQRRSFSCVPGAPAGVAGLVAVLGDIVPVFDLGCRLGLAPVADPADAPIALLSDGSGPVGFVVDEAEGMLDVTGLSLELVGAGLRELLGGVAVGAYWPPGPGPVSGGGAMVVLLDATATADWSPAS